MPILTIVILTFNEERHLARCLKLLEPLGADVVVVDSFSTDRTVEIATASGARILQHAFVNHAMQVQWALDTAEIATPWVMRLDADEILDRELIEEIKEKLPLLPPDVVGINMKRRHIFMGRWIRHGGRFPLFLLRMWRNGQGRVENRWMDEHMVVWGGRTITFDHCFSDVNLHDLSFFTAKHNSYATREAIDVLNHKYGLVEPDDRMSGTESSAQIGTRRRLKEQVYNRLPFWVGPTIYFSYRYIIQLGFLDGKEGLIYHFLQAFWYRFLIAAKLHELEMSLADATDQAQRMRLIEKATGHRLAPEPIAQNIAPRPVVETAGASPKPT